MQTTTNYGLKKPEGTDVVDIQNFNDNADTIDTELKKRVTTSDYTRQTVYAVDTGSANTYVVTLDPAPTALTEGICIAIKIKIASTGASTLNVNGLGAKTILDSLGNAITSGGLKAGIIYTMRYNGTNFIVQGKGGGGDATAPDLLSGKKATVDTGPIVGSMPNNGAVTITPSGSAQTISAGYHNGSGKVSAVTVPVANVLSGTTIAGQAGTMPNKGAVTITPGTADQTIPAGYHNGSGKVKGEPNLKGENIKEGISEFGIVGTLEGKLDITDYLKNIPNTYYPLSFIEGEGLYGYTNDSNSSIYLFDANGNIIKTIPNNDIDKPLFVGKDNILWVNYRNSSYNVRETDKNGTQISLFTLDPSSKVASAACYSEDLSKIYIAVNGYIDIIDSNTKSIITKFSSSGTPMVLILLKDNQFLSINIETSIHLYNEQGMINVFNNHPVFLNNVFLN